MHLHQLNIDYKGITLSTLKQKVIEGTCILIDLYTVA